MSPSSSVSSSDSSHSLPSEPTGGPGWWVLRLRRKATVIRKREEILTVNGNERVLKSSMVPVAERHEFHLQSRDRDDLQAWANAFACMQPAPSVTPSQRVSPGALTVVRAPARRRRPPPSPPPPNTHAHPRCRLRAWLAMQP